MLYVIVILTIIVCVLLSLVVLIQNPKGGGVNASFSGASQQIFGANKSSDIVEKTTWTLAGLLLIFCISSVFFMKSGKKTVANKPAVEMTEAEQRLKQLPSTTPIPTQQAPVQQAPAQQPAPTQAPK